MNIQKLGLKDASKVHQLIKEGMHPDNFGLTIYSTNKSIKYIEYLIGSSSQITGYYHYGYYLGNLLVGFAEWRDFGETFFLNNIYVSQNFRGKGIGKKLISHGINLSKKMNKKFISLDVFSNNKQAYFWYSSLGFKEIKKSIWFVSRVKMRDYYNGENLIINTDKKYIIYNYPQSLEILKQFGFSSINLVNHYSNVSLNIGLLGRKYFRIDNIKYLNDLEVIQLLKKLDPDRNIFLVCNHDEKLPTYFPFDEITGSIRMTKQV